MDSYFLVLLLVFVTLMYEVNVVNGSLKSIETMVDAPLLTQKIGGNRTIIVDITGKGDFKSIQPAIDSVPDMNSNWVIIHIRKGIYR